MQVSDVLMQIMELKTDLSLKQSELQARELEIGTLAENVLVLTQEREAAEKEVERLKSELQRPCTCAGQHKGLKSALWLASIRCSKLQGVERSSNAMKHLIPQSGTLL